MADSPIPDSQNTPQKSQPTPEPVSPKTEPTADASKVTPPVPPKPAAAATTTAPANENTSIDRRTFIKWTAVGWTAFAAIVGGYGTMILRYLFPNVLFEPKQTFRAGYPDDYQTGDVSLRWKDRYAVWIARDDEKIYALSTVCTHLGCTPNWLSNENKFKCPCHGSGFYKSGINFEGPAPRPLERFKITLADDGQIIVDKTRTYQQEKGEWKNPDSYLLV